MAEKSLVGNTVLERLETFVTADPLWGRLSPLLTSQKDAKFLKNIFFLDDDNTSSINERLDSFKISLERKHPDFDDLKIKLQKKP